VLYIFPLFFNFTAYYFFFKIRQKSIFLAPPYEQFFRGSKFKAFGFLVMDFGILAFSFLDFGNLAFGFLDVGFLTFGILNCFFYL